MESEILKFTYKSDFCFRKRKKFICCSFSAENYLKNTYYHKREENPIFAAGIIPLPQQKNTAFEVIKQFL